MLLLDVTPLSLGIETLGGVMTKLIQKNTTIPTKAQQVFSTADDNQTAVTIHVLQGERDMAARQQVARPVQPRRHSAGAARHAADRGDVRHRRQRHPARVGAKDKATGKENKITIKANSGLSEDEIQRMVKDAEAHAEEDKKLLELVQARNQADALVHSVKKSLGEYGDKVDAGEKEKIEAALKDAEDVAEGASDKAAIEAKTEALTTACAEARREDVRRRAGAAGAARRRGGRAARQARAQRRAQGRRRATSSTPSSRKSRTRSDAVAPAATGERASIAADRRGACARIGDASALRPLVSASRRVSISEELNG